MGSFGTEIKDFLGAATGVYKAIGSKEDREYKKARAAYMKAKGDLAADPAMRDLAKTKLQAQIDRLRQGPQMHPMQQKLLQQKIDYYKANMPGQGAVPASPADDASPTVGPQGALDVDYDTAAVDPSDEGYGDAGYDSELAASSGGMITSRGNKPKPVKAIKVKGYADGGTVEEDDIQDSYDDADNASAENQVADDVAPAEHASGDDGDGGEIDYKIAHEAALNGVKYSMDHHAAAEQPEGEGAVTTDMSAASRKPAVPGGRGGARSHYSGEGAVSASEMQALKQKLDPEHKLSENELNMKALSTVYEWTMVNKGPEAADRAAGSLTQYMRMASDRYKALAQAAAENGDVSGTVKNIARAYANIPDGRDVKFSNDNGKIKATFTDSETGKEVEKFIVTPDQMLQWATKGGIQSFDGLLARSAGGRAEIAAGAKASQDERKTAAAEATAAAKVKDSTNMKPSDRKIVRAEVDEAATDDPKVKETEGAYFPEIVSSAKSIAMQNGKLDGPSAFRVAREMVQVDPANPKRVTWAIAKDDKTGYYNVTLANGTAASIPPDTAARLNTIRVERMTAAQKALDSSRDAGARNQSTIRAGVAAAGNAVNAITPTPQQPTTGPFRKDTGPSIPLYRAGNPVPPAQDLDRINMARRASGQQPITLEQLQGQ